MVLLLRQAQRCGLAVQRQRGRCCCGAAVLPTARFRPAVAGAAAAGQRRLRGLSTASGFTELELHPPLLAALEELELDEPTEVQQAAVPAILGGDDVLIASETGSGKTLAYLLPIVHVLKQEEEVSRQRGRAVGARLQRPRAIVLVPSREVGRQVRGISVDLLYRVALAMAPQPHAECLYASVLSHRCCGA